MSNISLGQSPVSTEIKIFNVPDDESETIFAFVFLIQKFDDNSESITFTLKSHPDKPSGKEQDVPKPEPEVFTFDENGLCTFEHKDEESFIKGKIKIMVFDSAVGQFDNGLKNFFFNLTVGVSANPPFFLEGCFELLDQENLSQ